MRHVIWNGNVEHIEEHGLTVEDVEYVLDNPTNLDSVALLVCLASGATRRKASLSS